MGMGLTALVRRMESQGLAGYQRDEYEKVHAKKEAIEQLNTGFLLAWYLTIINKSLQPFACSSLGEGSSKSVLDGDPNITCWDSDEHMAITILGGAACIAFGFLLPFAMRAAIKRTASVKFAAGWERCEYLLILQKLVVAVSLALPRKEWEMQWAMCVVANGVMLLGQIWLKPRGLPYQDLHMNQLSLLTLSAEVITLVIGFAGRVSGSSAAIEWSFFIVVGVTTLGCARITWVSEEEMETTLEDGESVESRYGGQDEWHSCEVDQVNGDGSYDLLYDDGARELQVRRYRIRRKSDEARAVFEHHEEVDVRHRGRGGKLCPARIVSANGDGTYEIAYADGDQEQRVAAEMVFGLYKSDIRVVSGLKDLLAEQLGVGDGLAIIEGAAELRRVICQQGRQNAEEKGGQHENKETTARAKEPKEKTTSVEITPTMPIRKVL
jgi:hypothetical protein